MELAKKNLKDGFIQSNIKSKPLAVEIAFTTDNVRESINSKCHGGNENPGETNLSSCSTSGTSQICRRDLYTYGMKVWIAS